MEISMVAQDRAYATLRRWPRFMVDLPVRLHCDLPPRVHDARGSGLNAGGMAVRTALNLRVGDQIAVEFTPPYAQQAVIARTFVRNCNRHTYGVEFITENDDDYRTIGQIECELKRLAATMQ